MKGIIIYKGKYGATQQYAEWLGEEFMLLTMDVDKVDPEKLYNYDFIIMGSSVYIGKLLLGDWLKQNIAILQEKKLFLFVVCGTLASEKENQESMIKKNVPGSLLSKYEIFFLPGRLDIKKISWKHRFMLKLAALAEKDPARKKNFLHGFDDLKKENMIKLEEAIRSFKSKENESVEAGLSE